MIEFFKSIRDILIVLFVMILLSGAVVILFTENGVESLSEISKAK